MAPPTDLTPLERTLLAALAADGERSPGALALETGADLPAVLDAVARLRERGLLARAGFDACRLTDRGRAAVEGETA
ncbi:MAG: MarR family transcriptional regulator [Haloarculaceae archaeon]